MSTVQPFRVSYPADAISDLKERLARTRMPEAETVSDWGQGVPAGYIEELVSYWRDGYDFAARLDRMNSVPHFMTEIDGLNIHFIHQVSTYPNARPLLLTHGWPGSVFEFLNVIGPLTDPLAHGGEESDAFHVICPSLPGYGFSQKPTQAGCGIPRIARMWDELMLILGYDEYLAQGGDWGSRVTREIGAQNLGHCKGLHVNFLSVPVPEFALESSADQDRHALTTLADFKETGSAYAIQHSTRPQTLGYGLTDSPVGQLAWIIEKFYAWSDCDGHPENAISRDEMLDHVTLYWMTASATSSARLYWERAQADDGDQMNIELPAGYSLFPKEIHQTPESWARDYFKNLVYFNALTKGGHFAASEQPEQFVKEVRNCFAKMR